MTRGDRLTGPYGRLCATIEVQLDYFEVTLQDATGKVLGIEKPGLDDSFDQAKELAVILIGREVHAYSHEVYEQIRRGIVWT